MPGFYYDNMINSDDTTRLYLYKHESGTDEARVTRTSKINKDKDTIELLRCPINEDPSLSIAAQWGSTTTLLSDIGATLGSAIQNARLSISRLVDTTENTWNNITNMGTTQVRKFTQESLFNINEYTKVFKGLGNNIPLEIKGTIYPYIDKNGTYITVQTQLNTLLLSLYGESSVEEDSSETNKGLGDYITSFIDSITSTEDAMNEGGSKPVKVIRFNAPHHYKGIPNSFLKDQWMSGTLALCTKDRWVYNLLLNNLNVTVSRWSTSYKTSTSLQLATVNITLIPAVLISPMEQFRYLYSSVWSIEKPGSDPIDDSWSPKGSSAGKGIAVL